MNLQKRTKLEIEVELFENRLKDYKELGMIIHEEKKPLWVKRFISKCKGIGINDVMIVGEDSRKRDVSGYLSALKDKIRYKK